MSDIVYDIETYPNCFTIGLRHTLTKQQWCFEISDRKNEAQEFTDFMEQMFINGDRLVGFNNIGFDYPVIHMINDLTTYDQIYQKAMAIIKGDSFHHTVWPNEWKVDQLDLYKIHHFDNKAKSTSLKMLEFNMRMGNIEDLPFDVGTWLTDAQKDTLIEYMWHDITATEFFYFKTLPQIKFRAELSEKYGKDFTNHNDTKIGKEYFIMRLEDESPGKCYRYEGRKRKPVQTPRDSIDLGDVILPYIQFNQPEFKRIHNWFKNTTITETKGSIKDLHCNIDGFQYDFGTGGIHGSVESQIVRSDDYWIVEDWDVASYYPNLSIANNLAPEHLGHTFCRTYADMYQQRSNHAKGAPENDMLKSALNGVYGDSNNVYSPFYDPKYTMTITVNGQLSLCMLAEALLQLSELSMVQINTDGLTIRYPRQYKEWVHQIAAWWEQLTQLQLDHVEYSMMAIRDVNNYIAVGNGVKTKGAYDSTPDWHQNHGQLVVAKAAKAALVDGIDVTQFITEHADVMDFMLRTKVPRDSYLQWGGDKVSNIVRYYVSTDGDVLEKIMPAKGPEGTWKRANGLTDDYYNTVLREVGDDWDERIHTKSKSKYETRVTSYHQGYTVMLCNNVSQMTFADINYDYYINEANKLVEPLRGC